MWAQSLLEVMVGDNSVDVISKTVLIEKTMPVGFGPT
jgi:hypothetical protein